MDEPPLSEGAPEVPRPEDLANAYRHLLSCRQPGYLTDLTLELLHKFNNRMTGVIFSVEEVAQQTRGDEQLHQRLEKMRATLLDSLQLISTIGRLHFQPHAGERTYYSIERVVKSALPLLAMLLPKGTALHFQPPAEQLCFYGSTCAVEEILLHLFSNAGYAVSDTDGQVTIEVGGDETDSAGAQSWIVVRDNGLGFSAAIVPRLFSPLATDRAAQGHAGLGLYRAREIARGLGGELTAQNAATGGAELCLRLPQSHPEASA